MMKKLGRKEGLFLKIFFIAPMWDGFYLIFFYCNYLEENGYMGPIQRGYRTPCMVNYHNSFFL